MKYNLKVMYGLLFLTLVSIVGWIMNIVAVVNSSQDVITLFIVLRIVGIFVAPLGAVLGFF